MSFTNIRTTAGAASILLAFTLVTISASDAKRPPKPPPAPRFDRAQFMLMNLNRGPNSTGGYLAESHKAAFKMKDDLAKALNQLQQVEATYAKSRGRPDDKFLEGPGERIKQAQKTADQLLNELRDAEADLKSTIQQTMITDQ